MGCKLLMFLFYCTLSATNTIPTGLPQDVLRALSSERQNCIINCNKMKFLGEMEGHCKDMIDSDGPFKHGAGVFWYEPVIYTTEYSSPSVDV